MKKNSQKLRPDVFFIEKFPEHKDSIKSIEKITVNFSNFVYKLVLNNEEIFKVRIANNNHIISRTNEMAIRNLIKDPLLLTYETNTGNAIYKWIKGENPKTEDIDEDFLIKVVELANNYHTKNIKNNKEVIVHDHIEFFASFSKNMEEKYNKRYLELINKYKDLELVLAHNDISLKNLIYKQEDKSLILIDYEWGRINTKYWDFANFIRESNINLKQIEFLASAAKLNFQTLKHFVFLATYYALQLSFIFENNPKLDNYRSHLNKLLKLYFSWTKS